MEGEKVGPRASSNLTSCDSPCATPIPISQALFAVSRGTPRFVALSACSALLAALMIPHIPIGESDVRLQLCSAPPSRDPARNVQGAEAIARVQPIVSPTTKPEVVRR